MVQPITDLPKYQPTPDPLLPLGQMNSSGGLNSALVVAHQLVRDTVRNHDVRSAQLVLRRVDLLAKELVEGLEPGEDHRALHHLDVPLAQAVEVGADSNAPPRHLHDRFEC